MKKKEIFLVVVVIAFGLIYNAIRSGDGRVVFGGCSIKRTSLLDRKHPRDFPRDEIRGSFADVSDTAAAADADVKDGFKDLRRLKIDNPAGDIEVKESKDGTFLVKPTVVVYHRRETKAKAFSDKVKIVTRRTGKTLVVDVEAKHGFPYSRVRVKLECFIPADMEVTLRNRHGDVTVQDAGKNVSIYERHGEVFVKNLDTTVTIDSKHGMVRAYDIAEKLKVDIWHSKLKVKNIPAVEMSGGHMNVWMNDISEGVKISKISHSSVDLENIGRLGVRASHTKLKMVKIRDGADITDSHGSIYMTDIKGDILLDTRSCRIRVKDAVAGKVDVHNSYDDVDLQDITCDSMEVELKHGDLTLLLREVNEKVKVLATHADVVVKFPETWKPALNLSSQYGKIMDRRGTGSTIVTEHELQRLRSTAGKPDILIDAKYGDIKVKHYTPEARSLTAKDSDKEADKARQEESGPELESFPGSKKEDKKEEKQEEKKEVETQEDKDDTTTE